jgi:hypothetical protein
MPPTGQRGQIIFAAGDYFRRPATGARLCPAPGGISRNKLRQPAPAFLRSARVSRAAETIATRAFREMAGSLPNDVLRLVSATSAVQLRRVAQ